MNYNKNIITFVSAGIIAFSGIHSPFAKAMPLQHNIEAREQELIMKREGMIRLLYPDDLDFAMRNNELYRSMYADQNTMSPHFGEGWASIYGPSATASLQLEMMGDQIIRQLPPVEDVSQDSPKYKEIDTLESRLQNIARLYLAYQKILPELEAVIAEHGRDSSAYSNAFYAFLTSQGYDGVAASKSKLDMGRIYLVSIQDHRTGEFIGPYRVIILDCATYSTFNNMIQRSYNISGLDTIYGWFLELSNEVLNAAAIPVDNTPFVIIASEEGNPAVDIPPPDYKDITIDSEYIWLSELISALLIKDLPLSDIPASFKANDERSLRLSQGTLLNYLLGPSVPFYNKLNISGDMTDGVKGGYTGFPAGVLEQWNMLNLYVQAGIVERISSVPERPVPSLGEGIFFIEGFNGKSRTPLEVGYVSGQIFFTIYGSGAQAKPVSRTYEEILEYAASTYRRETPAVSVYTFR